MASARAFGWCAVVLALVASATCLIGLSGLQSVCADDINRIIADYNQRSAELSAAVQNAAENATLARAFNASRPPFAEFAKSLASSSSTVTCAKRYSLSWWCWVLQVALLIAVPLALTGGRMPAMGLPLLLAATGLMVMETDVCTRTLGFRSYSPAGQSGWASTVLAGFIIAAASNWILILSLPSLLRAEERRSEGGPLSKEIQL